MVDLGAAVGKNEFKNRAGFPTWIAKANKQKKKSLVAGQRIGGYDAAMG
jgi:hypothetical protein